MSDIFKNRSKLTPPGTPPNETRLNTKHKRPAYGQELVEKAAARRVVRAAKKAKAEADAKAKAAQVKAVKVEKPAKTK